MLRHFLLTALRNLLRHKLQSLINVASLAVGLAVFGFAFLYVKQELSYDQGWPEGERVHRLTLAQRGFPGLPDRSYFAALARSYERLMDRFGDDFEAATRVSQTGVHIPDTTTNYPLWFVDPAFIEILQPQVIEGDLARAVSGPGLLALDEAQAERMGLSAGVGDRITLAGFANGEVEYEIAAIYRLPEPVSPAARFPMLTLIHNYSLPLLGDGRSAPIAGPWENQVQVWVKLREGLGTEEFNAQQPEYIQQTVTDYAEALGPNRRISDHLFYNWQPVADMHFNPLTTEVLDSGAGYGDPVRVATFAVVGLLVLLVGCSNSISLSLAAAIERRREIGVCKAAGALPQDILRQRLGEAVLLSMLALVPAIAALELLLPAFQALLPFVEVDASWREYAMLTGIALLVGLACGIYPAFVLSATRPQVVLRSGAQGRAAGGMRLKNLLVAIQFFFASMLLIGTGALYLQLAIARNQPLGFDASNIVVLYQNGAGGAAALGPLRTELEKIPGVQRVIPASVPPNSGLSPTSNADTVIRNIGDPNEVNLQRWSIDFDFTELVGIRLLAGRDFDIERDNRNTQTGDFEGGGVERVMLNAAAVRQLGFASPQDAIDQPLYARRLNNVTGEIRQIPMQIIGVMEDNLYGSLRRRPGPELYAVIPRLAGGVSPVNVLMVKYEDSAEASIQQRIRDTADRVMDVPLSGMLFAEQELEAAFVQEQNESRLLMISGGLALLLASIGLYGLAAFAIERQVKEVGIRKVMGAQVPSIVALYLWRFARPIVIASMLAWPVAIYFTLEWIQRFPYQMERGWLLPVCIGALGAVLVIAMLTVSVITARAATANPVRSLRYE